MAHELGHILGMNHEQKRPDGSDSYYGPSAEEGGLEKVIRSGRLVLASFQEKAAR